MKIGVCGMSGVGKGEFIKKLTSALEKEGMKHKIYKEDTNQDLYKLALHDKNEMYLNQLGRTVNMLSRDTVAFHEQDEYEVQIFDRIPQEVIFYSKEFLTTSQRRKIKSVMDHLYLMSSIDTQYDCLIVLTAETETIFKRLEKRGRDNFLTDESKKKYKIINEQYYSHLGYSKLDGGYVYFLDKVTLEMMDEQIPEIIEMIKENNGNENNE